MDPVIPYIKDTKENVQEMVKKAKHYGAKYIYISTQVTMADVQRDYFSKKQKSTSAVLKGDIFTFLLFVTAYDCSKIYVSPLSTF